MSKILQKGGWRSRGREEILGVGEEHITGKKLRKDNSEKLSFWNIWCVGQKQSRTDKLGLDFMPIQGICSLFSAKFGYKRESGEVYKQESDMTGVILF